MCHQNSDGNDITNLSSQNKANCYLFKTLCQACYGQIQNKFICNRVYLTQSIMNDARSSKLFYKKTFSTNSKR